jgi:hypothetical protein
VGKHPIPAKSTVYPRFQFLSLKEIGGVHRAVCEELEKRAQEPPVGLEDVSDELINDVFKFPRIAVVPIPGEPGYWCWIGVRVFRRLVDRKWSEKVAVLDYGPGMSEATIVDQALKDWKYSPAVMGQSAKADWATAQEWNADSKYVCRPHKRGSRRRPNGRNAYADLRGLNPRRLGADKATKTPKSTVEMGIRDRRRRETRT